MVKTFENRLSRRSMGVRLGPTRGISRPIQSDLRNRIRSNVPTADARTLLKNRRQGRNAGNWDARALLRRTTRNPIARSNKRVPFLIPIKTVKNEHYNQNFQVKKTFRPPRNPKLPFAISSSDELPSIPIAIGRSGASASQVLSPIQGFRVDVRNLQPSVTLDDVYELFSSVGSLRLCNLIRPGLAEVVYNDASDAMEAVKRYNGRELDGRPMTVRVLTPVSPGATSTSFLSRLGPTVGAATETAKNIPRRQFSPRKSDLPVVQPIDIETDVIRKALFNVSFDNKGPRRPVAFNVSLR